MVQTVLKELQEQQELQVLEAKQVLKVKRVLEAKRERLVLGVKRDLKENHFKNYF
jgi:hypothetical protein